MLKRMNNIGCWLALACIGLAAPWANAGDGRFVIATAVRQPYTAPDRDGFLDLLIAEMFRRVGEKGEMYVYETPERPLINANNGVDDGTALRIKGLENQYPNLARVPEKLLDNDFVAYSLRHEFSTTGWQTLAPHQVAYLVGWKVFENNLPASQPATPVREPSQLYELLRLNRVDLVLYERWQGNWWARELKLPVKALEPPLATAEMFLYLHKRHAALAGKLAAALSGMKRDGTYKRIFDQALTPPAKGR